MIARRRGRLAGVACVLVAAAALPGCLFSSGGPAAAHGTASVACAGSLLTLYQDKLGPAFARATGDRTGGPPCAGSSALAQQILANEIDPGVFLSLGTKAISTLFPAHRARAAIAIASDPLVVAYSPNSRYYAQLQAIRTGRHPLSALFALMASPGFKLGRTDPTQDPQGVYFLLMCELAKRVLRLPAGEVDRALAITASAPYGTNSQLFDEAALPTDISTGSVDAGSAYLPQARQLGLDYITLPPSLDFATPSMKPLYRTVSLVVDGKVIAGGVINVAVALVTPGAGTTVPSKDSTADTAFVTFLLGDTARAILRRAGFLLHPPVVLLAPGVASAAAALPGSVDRRIQALGGTTESP